MAAIDHHLARHTCHFRTRSGQLLTSLDQVIRAILADDLALNATGANKPNIPKNSEH